jgi:hypothetical protein
MKSKRSELETWDMLLREKDKKLTDEQIKNDTKEKQLNSTIEELRINTIDYNNLEAGK